MEVACEVGSFTKIRADVSGASDLVVHAAGVRAFPHRQTIMIGVVGEPAVEVFAQLIIITGTQPFVVISPLLRAENRNLRQKRLEHLLVLLPDPSRDESVGLLERHERLEVRETVVADAVVTEIQVLEVEIPIVKLSVSIAR